MPLFYGYICTKNTGELGTASNMGYEEPLASKGTSWTSPSRSFLSPRSGTGFQMPERKRISLLLKRGNGMTLSMEHLL